jgi:hypothetical protein
VRSIKGKMPDDDTRVVHYLRDVQGSPGPPVAEQAQLPPLPQLLPLPQLQPVGGAGADPLRKWLFVSCLLA